MENHHWYQWFYDGFWCLKPLVAMVFQWFLVRKLLVAMAFPMVFWSKNHCNQWFFNGFVVRQPLDTMVFQWFPMVANHWSDDGMVKIHRSGLACIIRRILALFAFILSNWDYSWLRWNGKKEPHSRSCPWNLNGRELESNFEGSTITERRTGNGHVWIWPPGPVYKYNAG